VAAPSNVWTVECRGEGWPEGVRGERLLDRPPGTRLVAAEVAGTSVGVPRPVPARDGALVVERAGRCCSMLTWIDGRVLKDRRGLGPRSTYLLGEALGRIHAAAARFDPPPQFELPRWDAETMFATDSPFASGPMDGFLRTDALHLFQHVVELTHAVFDQLDRTPAPRGIIHNDFILINCHFTRRGGAWRVGVLDFDDLGWGYTLYDLAPLLGNLADWPGRFGTLSREFLSGYRSVQRLPSSLERHLPVLMAARHAVSLMWLAGMYRRGETDLPVRRHIEARVEGMRECLALRRYRREAATIRGR
jgi:Ser/Thr protein kinase RdoA (MazF antagonist)